MRHLAAMAAVALLAACTDSGNQASSLEENPATAVPADRLVDTSTGNETRGETDAAAAAIDPNPLGASAPGAATSGGEGAGQGGSEGGRSLGDQPQQ